ncbi:MAG: MFS transporter [Actinomycetota bacterium]|nr:MFS transporter [Actinomycetota bacterium]MDA3014533.1 MFS transporter [Actinomycetota bacterium]MDA3027260.1 MFS transporter [Actinomycetota bacterium]
MRRPVPVYIGALLTIGLTMTVVGPALTELRQRTGASIGAIGSLFVASSLGFMAGSFLGGRLYDQLVGHRVLASALTSLGLAVVVIPHVQSLPLLFIVFVWMGVAAAVVEVGSNTLVMWHMGADVGRSMNLLHLAFGFGALITPVLTRAGLAVVTTVGAVVAGMVALLALAVETPTLPTARRDEQTGATRRLLTICSVFFLMYVGLEVGFAGWILTYAEEIDFSARAATTITSVFWVTFTAGRLVSAVAVNRVRPKVVMISASVLTVTAAVLMVIGSTVPTMVWLGVALMGLATAPQFPVMLAYLERRMRLTGSDNSWFVGAAGLGGLVFPFITGQVFDGFGPGAYPWTILLLAVVTVGSFAWVNRTFGG